MCTVTPSGSGSVAWVINRMAPHGLSAIRNGIAPGYANNLGNNNLIIKNIMMNDNRNDSEYQCVIIMTIMRGNNAVTEITQRSNATTLYVAGE